MSRPKPIACTLVHGRAAARRQLTRAIETAEDFRLLEADSTEVRKEEPIIVVLGDSPMTSEDPASKIGRLRLAMPAAHILVCSETSDGDSVIAALRAGAAGYLVAPVAAELVLDAARAILAGDCPLSSLATRRLVESLRKSTRPLPPPALSAREAEVFSALVAGLRYRQIAQQLYISLETVRSHIRRIYRKLEVSSRAELTARWVIAGTEPGRIRSSNKSG